MGQSGPPKGIGNVSSAINFNWLKEYMLERDDLSDKERLMLCIPAIAEAMTKYYMDPENIQGWLYLRDMFYKWFSEKSVFYLDMKLAASNNPDCFMVDWDWVMRFPRALTYYESFIHPPRQSEEVPNNIYNLAAKNQLGKLLGEDKYLDSLEPGQPRSFDFSMKPENEWLKWSFNFISVPRQLLPIVDDWNFTADGLQCSLASFSLRALAAGQVEKMTNGSYHITVKHCWVFVHDEFSFEDDDFFYFWSCKEKRWWWFDILESFQYGITGETEHSIHCRNFRDFRSHRGYGNNFTVLSNMHAVENYESMSYVYPL